MVLLADDVLFGDGEKRARVGNLRGGEGEQVVLRLLLV